LRKILNSDSTTIWEEIIKEHKGYLLEIGGIANHVHLLISLSNLDNYSGMIRDTKSGSSFWMNKTIPSTQKFEWQEGYGSFVIQFGGIDSVRTYIKNQEEHHQQHTFEEEYLKFLDMHQVDYDSRFVFG
jgi:REP element-mobilizing transposase RayT